LPYLINHIHNNVANMYDFHSSVENKTFVESSHTQNIILSTLP